VPVPDDVGLADLPDLAAGADIERAAAMMCTDDDLPPHHRIDAASLDELTAAQTDGRPEARDPGPVLTLTTFAHLPWNARFHARRGFRVLRVDETGPALRAVLRAEAESGLQNRVAMGRPLAP
jgi:hypothetical protein